MYLKIEIDSINRHYLVLRAVNTNVKHFFSSSLFSLISRFQNSNYQCIITSDDNSAEMCDGWWLQLSCMRCKLCRGILRLFSSIYMGQVCEHTLRELSTHSYTCCIQYAMKYWRGKRRGSVLAYQLSYDFKQQVWYFSRVFHCRRIQCDSMITGEHKSSLNDTAIKSLLAAAEA